MKALLDSLRPGDRDWELAAAIHPDRLPAHIAIIMDGNGRWAKAKNMIRVQGHRAGAESVRDVVKAAGEFGVKYLTLYAFSVENWNRPREEVGALMGLLEFYLKKELETFVRDRVRLRVRQALYELGVRARRNAALIEPADLNGRVAVAEDGRAAGQSAGRASEWRVRIGRLLPPQLGGEVHRARCVHAERGSAVAVTLLVQRVPPPGMPPVFIGPDPPVGEQPGQRLDPGAHQDVPGRARQRIWRPLPAS